MEQLYPFVTRENELAALGTHLDLVLRGQGRVCFVAGEAGSGKTALVTEFVRRVQEADADLLVGIGECNAQTGAGDPYLPFREMLRFLTGDAEADQTHPAATEENTARLRRFLRIGGEALVESGPDLIGIFVPGGSLLARLGAKIIEQTPALSRLQGLVQRKAQTGASADQGKLEQNQLFEQYTNVLRSMAAAHPLLLVLDDLHWADEASLGLLFHLARRIEDSRILVLGTYRPNDVALGRRGERHPLTPVLNELQRYFGDVHVELATTDPAEQRRMVDALIDSQPNRLGPEFRQRLCERTQGHPLFVVELLRHLQETNGLVRDAQEHWIAGPELRWDALPARVEGVIEERIGRLENELRETLSTASIEGEQFTAEVTARVRLANERDIVRQLSAELEKQHHLVSAQGAVRIGPLRFSSYRFRHSLFHAYVYGRLDAIERSYLHEDIGRVLEELYADRAEEIAVQLARHFEVAGDLPKAIRYLHQAGQRAQRHYANVEAILHFRNALRLLDRLGTEPAEEPAARAIRLAVLESLGDVLERSGRGEEARVAYTEVLASVNPADRVHHARLHRKIGDTWISQHRIEEALQSYDAAEQVLDAETALRDPGNVAEWLQIQLQRMWSFYFVQRDPGELASLVRPVIELHGTPEQQAKFFVDLAVAQMRACRYVISDEIYALAAAAGHASETSGEPGPIATSHYIRGVCHLFRGEVAAAEHHLLEARQVARRAGAVPQLIPALAWLSVAYRLQGKIELTHSTVSEALTLATSAENPTYILLANLNLAWVDRRGGRLSDAKERAQPALDAAKQRQVVFPFRWLGEWPLLAVALAEDRLGDAVEHAREMLDPSQQQLPAPLWERLAEAVQGWDAGDPVSAGTCLAELLPVAEASGYL